MKSTGIVRKVDELGRIVLPIELRRTLEINEGDPIEIYTEGENIILRKHNNGCYKCNEVSDEYENILGRNICPKCLVDINEKISKLDNLRGCWL